ncbi:MAG: 2Fe-2S iron-sulfur cluster binding domain-containing protein [Formivibrio sp.]|nr:2Fe-2S iron-sulfur cluster binding domain-containing protein [Formivibrio sp.]
MPEITLVTRDGARLGFGCGADENVLDAAAAAGLFLPAMCHEGSCGLCHASVAEGAYEMGSYTKDALSDADQNGVLLCRCQPRGDLVVNLPYPQADIQRHEVVSREAAIVAFAPAGAGAVAVTLALKPHPELGQAADFVPGQYMELTIPGTDIRRAYSLANLPNWDGRLEFLIRLQKGGEFSSYLAERAKVGDTLITRGPLGNFVLDETSPRPRCLIGGGCGFAPVLSILRHLANFQDTQPTHLILGANREDELFPSNELNVLRAALPHLGVTLSVWRPEADWGGFTGTAAEAFSGYLESCTETPDVYVCGPPKMLEAVKAVAQDRRIPPERIIAEHVS